MFAMNCTFMFSVHDLCVYMCVPRLTEEMKGLSSETETIRAKLKKRGMKERQDMGGWRKREMKKEIHTRKEGNEGQDNAALSLCVWGGCVCVW